MNRALRWLPWASIAVLFVLLQCHEWFGPDIWYHLYLGGAIVRTLSPQPPDNLILHQAGYLNLYWVFQLIVRGVFAVGGVGGVTAMFIGVWAVALGCWISASGVRRAGAWGPLLALLAVLICKTRFEPRPEAFSFALMAIAILLLSKWPLERKPTGWEYARIVVLQVAWSNMHGYFAFGPMLVGARLAGALALRFSPEWPTVRKGTAGLWLLLALVLLATVITPFGIGNWREVVVLGKFLRQMRFSVQEGFPTYRVPLFFGVTREFWVWWFAVLAAAFVTLFKAPRKELFALLLAGAGLALSAYSYRNIPLVIFMSAPLAAAVLPRVSRFGLPRRIMDCAVAAAGAVLSVLAVTNALYASTGGLPVFGIGVSTDSSPIYFADYLRSSGFRGSIFNDSIDGGFLEFEFPDLRLYADTRWVDPGLIRGYFLALSNPDAWRAMQRKQGFDSILLRVSESPRLIAELLRDPGWKMAYADLQRAFFVNLRTVAGAAAPVREPEFYHGEDLAVPLNAGPAAQWVALLAGHGDRAGVLLALAQFSRAPEVPARVLEIALRYGRNRYDPEIIDAARALRPKMVALHPSETEAVDALLLVKAGP